jgi:hypothetical protein
VNFRELGGLLPLQNGVGKPLGEGDHRLEAALRFHRPSLPVRSRVPGSTCSDPPPPRPRTPATRPHSARPLLLAALRPQLPAHGA